METNVFNVTCYNGDFEKRLSMAGRKVDSEGINMWIESEYVSRTSQVEKQGTWPRCE